MSCELAGIKVAEGVIINGFYNNINEEFIIGNPYFCGTDEDIGKITTTPSNLYIGRAVTKHKIKLDIRRFDNVFYTQISNTYFQSTVNVSGHWVLTAPESRTDEILNLQKGDLINFLAPTNSIDNQYITLNIQGIESLFLLTKHEGSSLTTNPIMENDLIQGTWVTAFYSPDELSVKSFRVDLATKGEFLKITGGVLTGEIQVPVISFKGSDSTEAILDTDKLIQNNISSNLNAIDIKTRSSTNALRLDFSSENPAIYTTDSDNISINNRRISFVKDPEDPTDAVNLRYVQSILASANKIGKIEPYLINITSPSADDLSTSGYSFLDGREIHLSEFLILYSELDKLPVVDIEVYNQMRLNNLRGSVGYFGLDSVNNKIRLPYFAPGDALLSSMYLGSGTFEPGFFQQDQVQNITGSLKLGGVENIFDTSELFSTGDFYERWSGHGEEHNYSKWLDLDLSRVARTGDRVFTSGICTVFKIYIGVPNSDIIEVFPHSIPLTIPSFNQACIVKLKSNCKLYSTNVSADVLTTVLINGSRTEVYGNTNIPINLTDESQPVVGVLSSIVSIKNFKIVPQQVVSLADTYQDTELNTNTWYLYSSYIRNKILINKAAEDTRVVYNKEEHRINIDESIPVYSFGTEDKNLINVPRNTVDSTLSGIYWSTAWNEITNSSMSQNKVLIQNLYLTRVGASETINKNYRYRVYNDSTLTEYIIVNDAPASVTPGNFLEWDYTQIRNIHLVTDNNNKHFSIDIACTDINGGLPMTLLTSAVYKITIEGNYRIRNNSTEPIYFVYVGEEGTRYTIVPDAVSDNLRINTKWTLDIPNDEIYTGRIVLESF